MPMAFNYNKIVDYNYNCPKNIEYDITVFPAGSNPKLSGGN